MDRIAFSMNSRKTSGTAERIVELQEIKEKMMDILKSETRATPLPALVPGHNTPKRGRVVLSKQKTHKSPVRKMAKRTELKDVKMEPPTLEFYTGCIKPKDLNTCVLCDDSQPQLDHPDDEEVMVGSTVYWWGCTGCQAWAHPDCMQTRNCPICEGIFEPTG
ncbi:hypothetical protein ANCCAN_06938 [Ancylostoma caninum]|uniref:Uncharacterized protein n=1 Tax=Ancylostoma caninum TaxID=29170 RepID=A0A368GVL8_ANCCA|nr:hypothetical protein ANCCAN_06938 [Ancylostoma caninum]